MALITCKECSQQVSEYAQTCQHCGFPPQNGRRMPIEVIVTDVDMHFGTMISFMVKLVLAAIPAIIILFIFAAVAFSIFSAIIHK